MHAQILRTRHIFLISILFLAGCGTFDKKIDVTVQAADRQALALPLVDEIDLDPLSWYIVTEETAQDVFDELEKQGADPVIFGLTDNGYENISLNQAKTLKLIKQLKAQIKALEEYYIEEELVMEDEEIVDDNGNKTK